MTDTGFLRLIMILIFKSEKKSDNDVLENSHLLKTHNVKQQFLPLVPQSSLIVV